MSRVIYAPRGCTLHTYLSHVHDSQRVYSRRAFSSAFMDASMVEARIELTSASLALALYMALASNDIYQRHHMPETDELMQCD